MGNGTIPSLHEGEEVDQIIVSWSLSILIGAAGLLLIALAVGVGIFMTRKGEESQKDDTKVAQTVPQPKDEPNPAAVTQPDVPPKPEVAPKSDPMPAAKPNPIALLELKTTRENLGTYLAERFPGLPGSKPPYVDFVFGAMEKHDELAKYPTLKEIKELLDRTEKARDALLKEFPLQGGSDVELWRALCLVNSPAQKSLVISVPLQIAITKHSGSVEQPKHESKKADSSEKIRFFTGMLKHERGNRVFSVSFSPDGNRLACGIGQMDPKQKTFIGGALKVWNTVNGQELTTITGFPAPVHCVSFGSDNVHVTSATSSGAEVKLWDTATGKEKRAFTAITGKVGSPCFNLDGTLLASGGDSTARIWDLSKNRELHSFKIDGGAAVSVSLSPNGRLLAVGNSNGVVSVWDTASKKQIMTSKAQKIVDTVQISPDGRLLASGGVDTVKVFDIARGQELLNLDPKTLIVTRSVCFSPDGKRLAAGGVLNPSKLFVMPNGGKAAIGTITIWDIETGTELLSIPSSQEVYSVCFSPDGKRLAAGTWVGAAIWDLSELKQSSGPSPIPPTTDLPKDTKPETLVVVGEPKKNESVKVTNRAVWKALYEKSAHNGQVRVAFSQDGKSIATAGGLPTELKLWNLADGMLKKTVACRGNTVTGLDFSPDSKTVAYVIESGGLGFHDSETGKEKKPLPFALGQPHSFRFSQKGTYLAVGFKGSKANTELIVIDWSKRKEVARFPGEVYEIKEIAFSSDEKTIAWSGFMSSTGHIRSWDLVQRKPLRSFTVTDKFPHTMDSLAFRMKDNQLIFREYGVGSDFHVVVWDPRKAKETSMVVKSAGTTFSEIAVSPTSKLLAVWSTGTVRILDTENWEEKYSLSIPGHEHRVFFNHSDDKIAMTSGRDPIPPVMPGTDGSFRVLSLEPATTSAKPVEPKKAIAAKARPVKYLSDLPEFDVKVYRQFGKNGDTGYAGKITVNGVQSRNGLSMHSLSNDSSTVKYKLGGTAASFIASVAVNDSAVPPPATPLTFKVLGDGKLLWKSKPVDRARLVHDCNVDLTGVDVLELRVDCPGSFVNAQAVWLEPRVVMK